MDIDSLVEQIIDLVYNAGCIHEDPHVQELMVRTDLYNLIDDYVAAPIENENEREVRRLEQRIIDLENEVDLLEDEKATLQERLAEAYAA